MGAKRVLELIDEAPELVLVVGGVGVVDLAGQEVPGPVPPGGLAFKLFA